MKRFSLLLIAVGMTAVAFAADEWKQYFTDGTVQIFYRYSDCKDVANGINQQKVIFRFVNTGSKKVVVNFGKTMNYGTQTVNSDVKNYSVTLNAQQTLEGNCDGRDKAFYIFSKHLNFKGSELKSFDLKNISVKTIE